MRFESEDAGDDFLEDDLALLGQQLRDDADHLEAQYPAPPTDISKTVELASRKNGALRLPSRPVTLAALASVVLLCAGWAVLRPLLLQNHQPRSATVGQRLDQAEPLLRGADSTIKNSHHVASDNNAAQPAGVADDRSLDPPPALFLQEVSGPEMEGLFDLWEQEATATMSVSI